MSQLCSGQVTVLAVHDALRQRPALVRAAVGQREDLVVGGAEHRDVAVRECSRRARPADAECPRAAQTSIQTDSMMVTRRRSMISIGEYWRTSRRRRSPARSATGRVASNCEREQQALVQRLRRAAILDHALAFDVSRPTRLPRSAGALEVAAFLAVELQEGAGVIPSTFLVCTLPGDAPPRS